MKDETVFMFRSGLEPGSRFWEGLRISAAFVGMDHIPLIVFMDDAVRGLTPGALPLQSLWEYLKATADLAGIHALKESLEERGLTLSDLDPQLSVQQVDMDKLAYKIANYRVVAIF